MTGSTLLSGVATGPAARATGAIVTITARTRSKLRARMVVVTTMIRRAQRGPLHVRDVWRLNFPGPVLCVRQSAPEAAVALLVLADGAQEVDAAEVRPVWVAEVELGMRALPEKETGEPNLARRSDYQVGVGEAGRV